ncbi:hypothetical protein GIB67_033496 [Kingdonia uniflora]|uniref:Protein tesmin/TSO1-like CXC 2 n=1 Tax=Kingdonia uniflora TaxID=39325 RepID=A0A7J7L667_9MAGN|nr:hypothetical protein GIB67_033496 [Kingdonia uniflora]
MDTPQKNQICTPMSKFEDSPVFNYINSLSPIKPVKSLHIAQTLNSLTYASPPSVFTSPHVNFQKEPSILKRHYFPSSSKPEFSSEDGRESSMCGRSLEAVRMSDSAVDFPDSCDPGIPIREVTAVPTNETAELPIELPQTLNYVCGIPELTLGPNNIETDPLPLICEREEVAVEMHHSSESGVELQGTHEFEQTKIEGTGNDWETLISNPADVLIYDSINNPEGSSGQETLVHSENNSHSPVAKLMEYGFDDSHKSNQHVTEGPAAQLEELKFQKETDHTPHILSSTFQSMQVVPCDESDEKAGDCTPLGCKQQRGIRRRCLVFESVGSQKKSMVDTRHSSSFASLSDGKFGSRDTHLVPFRPTTGSSPCLLPGIGLHLNALAATTKDSRVVKHETLASGKRLISMPTSIASFHSNKPLALSSVRSDMGIAGNIFQISQDDSSGPNFGEELNESSPRKKRLKLEQAGESSCKRCNCKKSKCLKL